MKTNMTAEKTTTYEEMMKDFNGANKSTLAIAPEVIAQAVENGHIAEVGRNNLNVYYEFNLEGLTGDILMHVRENQYVVISKFLVREDHSIVDVIPYLMQYRFCIGNVSTNRNRGIVLTNIKKADGSGHTTLYLHRLLTAIELNIKIEELNTYYQVHHKGACFDDRQGMTMYISRKEHKHSTSHITGGEIASMDEFMYFFGCMARQYDEMWLLNEVA